MQQTSFEMWCINSIFSILVQLWKICVFLQVSKIVVSKSGIWAQEMKFVLGKENTWAPLDVLILHQEDFLWLLHAIFSISGFLQSQSFNAWTLWHKFSLFLVWELWLYSVFEQNFCGLVSSLMLGRGLKQRVNKCAPVSFCIVYLFKLLSPAFPCF